MVSQTNTTSGTTLGAIGMPKRRLSLLSKLRRSSTSNHGVVSVEKQPNSDRSMASYGSTFTVTSSKPCLKVTTLEDSLNSCRYSSKYSTISSDAITASTHGSDEDNNDLAATAANDPDDSDQQVEDDMSEESETSPCYIEHHHLATTPQEDKASSTTATTTTTDSASSSLSGDCCSSSNVTSNSAVHFCEHVVIRLYPVVPGDNPSIFGSGPAMALGGWKFALVEEPMKDKSMTQLKQEEALEAAIDGSLGDVVDDPVVDDPESAMEAADLLVHVNNNDDTNAVTEDQDHSIHAKDSHEDEEGEQEGEEDLASSSGKDKVQRYQSKYTFKLTCCQRQQRLVAHGATARQLKKSAMLVYEGQKQRRQTIVEYRIEQQKLRELEKHEQEYGTSGNSKATTVIPQKPVEDEPAPPQPQDDEDDVISDEDDSDDVLSTKSLKSTTSTASTSSASTLSSIPPSLMLELQTQHEKQRRKKQRPSLVMLFKTMMASAKSHHDMAPRSLELSSSSDSDSSGGYSEEDREQMLHDITKANTEANSIQFHPFAVKRTVRRTCLTPARQ